MLSFSKASFVLRLVSGSSWCSIVETEKLLWPQSRTKEAPTRGKLQETQVALFHGESGVLLSSQIERKRSQRRDLKGPGRKEKPPR